jgi:hypothetical protein
LIDDPQAFLNRQAKLLPNLPLIKPVAHVPARGDNEIFAFLTLGLAELRVEVAQSEPAERDVPRLVLHHIGVDRSRERILRLVTDALERR